MNYGHSNYVQNSLFQALGGWGRTKEKRASEGKKPGRTKARNVPFLDLVLPRFFYRLFARPQLSTESLEQAMFKEPDGCLVVPTSTIFFPNLCE